MRNRVACIRMLASRACTRARSLNDTMSRELVLVFMSAFARTNARPEMRRPHSAAVDDDDAVDAVVDVARRKLLQKRTIAMCAPACTDDAMMMCIIVGMRRVFVRVCMSGRARVHFLLLLLLLTHQRRVSAERITNTLVNYLRSQDTLAYDDMPLLRRTHA